MDDAKVKACFEQYLKALIQKPRLFVFLRQAVGRCSQIENARHFPCSYSAADSALHVKPEEGSSRTTRFSVIVSTADRANADFTRDRTKTFLLSSFEKIEWGSVSGQSGSLKYINITVKDDRNPIVLHGPTEIMELWYDGLRLIHSQAPVETAASNAKIEVFTKAVGFAAMTRPTIMDDPPLPEDYKFVGEFPPTAS
jgi:hypothetical protein